MQIRVGSYLREEGKSAAPQLLCDIPQAYVDAKSFNNTSACISKYRMCINIHHINAIRYRDPRRVGMISVVCILLQLVDVLVPKVTRLQERYER